MSLITWSDELSVGIASIDEQHKRLVYLVNKLHDAMIEGKAKKVLKDIFIDLVNYTIKHFSFEEGIMERNGYPEFTSHKQQHENLKQQVSDLNSKLEGGDFMIGVETKMFLKDWLINHIMKTDKQYSDFLVGKGVV